MTTKVDKDEIIVEDETTLEEDQTVLEGKDKDEEDQTSEKDDDDSSEDDKENKAKKPEKGKTKAETVKEMKEHIRADLADADFGFVKEDLDVLFEGEELSEETKDKALTIFEAAVNEKVSKIEESIVTKADELIESAVETFVTESEEKIDTYLSYVTEKYMEENKLAIEAGVKVEMAEGFLTDITSLMEKYNLSFNDEKIDVVEDLETRVKDLKEKLNSALEENVELKSEIEENEIAEAFDSVTESLTDVDKEKVFKLAEGIDYSDIDNYKEKLEIIKEKFVVSKKSSDKEVKDDVEINENLEVNGNDEEVVSLSPDINRYASYMDQEKQRAS